MTVLIADVKELPEAEYLSEALRYEAETGLFFWRERPDHHFQSASRARAWNAKFGGAPAFRTMTHGYRAGKVDGVTYFAHRVAWKIVHGDDPAIIDHINGVRDDNRITNLESGSQADNMKSAMRRGALKATFAANTWESAKIRPRRVRRGWAAKIYIDRKCYHLGVFQCLGMALRAKSFAELANGRR